MPLPSTSRGQSCTTSTTLTHVYYFSIQIRTWLKMISVAVERLTVLPWHTEGGGEPLPISGTFSYRGFPANSIDWFLIDEQRQEWASNWCRSNHLYDYANFWTAKRVQVHNCMHFAFSLINLHQHNLTCTLEVERWRRLVVLAAGCSRCPDCCCSCRSCAHLCGLCCTAPCAVTAG